MDKFLNKHHTKFTWLMDWIYILVMINLYAIAGTLLGLVVFGFFPSWMTAHQLIKRRLQQEEFPLFKTFVSTYRSYFWRSNGLGYILAFVGGIIALSWFYYLEDLTTTFHWIGLIGVGFVAIILLLMMGITPISFVYFPKFTIREHLKFTLIMTMGMPGLALIIFFNSLFFYGLVLIRFISIFPFLAYTLPVLVNLLFARQKLLKLFTIFQDDHVMIRTLNSYANHEGLVGLWQEGIEGQGLSSERMMDAMRDETQIHRRASLVLTNAKEEPLGMMLVRIDQPNIVLELLYIDPSYRKRGYAKKMLIWLEQEAKKVDLATIKFGDDMSLYQGLPMVLQSSLAFFHKLGFERQSGSHGYQFHKKIGGHAS